MHDAAVVGAGPAGLAFAIAAARAGLDVVVLERRRGALDKACGEGLLPAAVRALDALGVSAELAREDAWPIREIRWIDGERCAAAGLPPPFGAGVRRTALSSALLARARRLRIPVRQGVEVRAHRRERGGVVVDTDAGPLSARVLVAADGLASPTRAREGLEGRRPESGERFGLRRHLAVAPWSHAVEVHFGPGVEAYVTPVGAGRVCVAFLFERERAARFEDLLALFPALAARLDGAPVDSAPRGAGPLARSARARTADRVVLLGDAAGYVDAVTGEGIALGIGCALDLAELLPRALARGASRAALAPYEAAWRRRFVPYWAWTRLVLRLARSPSLRRRVLGVAAAVPAPFERMVRAAVG